MDSRLWKESFWETDETEKRHERCQQAVQDESMTMEKSWAMMMPQTDKEHC